MKFSTLVRGRAITKRKQLRNRLRPTCPAKKIPPVTINRIGSVEYLGCSLSYGLVLIRDEQLARRTMAHK